MVPTFISCRIDFCWYNPAVNITLYLPAATWVMMYLPSSSVVVDLLMLSIFIVAFGIGALVLPLTHKYEKVFFDFALMKLFYKSIHKKQ